VTLILGIETSCDETAASVVEDGCAVRSNTIASQHDLHHRYRGVVPEIASRAHLERIIPIVDQAMQEAGVGFDQIDAVAVGNRPGLIGSLIVGVSAAKAIAWSAGKPLLGVDHIRAHLYAGALVETPQTQSCTPPAPPTTPRPTTRDTSSLAPVYPALGLVVSGGHTSLYEIESPTQMQPLGRTIDDAVGAVAVHGYAGVVGLVISGFVLWGQPATAGYLEEVAVITPWGQTIGAVIMFLVLGFIPAFAVAWILKSFGVLRIPEAVELVGLDLSAEIAEEMEAIEISEADIAEAKRMGLLA